MNHIFAQENDVFYLLLEKLNLVNSFLKKFSFDDHTFQLSIDSTNEDPRYKWALQVFAEAIDKLKLTTRQAEDPFTKNGPKLEIFVKDIFDKEWQLSSIQLDIFSTVEQDLKYINQDGDEKEIVVLRSTILGSLERLTAILLEQNGGALPFWLTPIQIIVLPISEKYHDYANQVMRDLSRSGFRTELDKRDETLQYRIREAQENYIPYMAIVGSKEASSGSLSVRHIDKNELGLMHMEEFLEIIKKDLS